jgi:threonine dehydratase
VPITLADIRAARERIAGRVLRTPCLPAPRLADELGCDVYCKLENAHPTGSFKERGACNRLLLLDDSARKRGVIAASAGNHALGLAYHGGALGIPVTVVMPVGAPFAKVSRCRALGARVLLSGNDFDSARNHAHRLCEEHQLTYVNGFDDPDIIAGAGTLGLELLDDVPGLDAIIVPVGGGGLLAGVATAVKSVAPHVRVIGVEPVAAPTLRASLDSGKPVRVGPISTLADGLAIAQIGTNCYELIRGQIDDLVLVDEASLATAILRLLEWQKTLVEGAGAAPLAGLMSLRDNLRGMRVVLPLCGGNIDISVVGRVIEHGLAIDGRLFRFTASVPDRPGGLASLSQVIAETGASVREISHDRHFAGADVGTVLVHCLLETRDPEHIRLVRQHLGARGVKVLTGERL